MLFFQTVSKLSRICEVSMSCFNISVPKHQSELQQMLPKQPFSQSGMLRATTLPGKREKKSLPCIYTVLTYSGILVTKHAILKITLKIKQNCHNKIICNTPTSLHFSKVNSWQMIAAFLLFKCCICHVVPVELFGLHHSAFFQIVFKQIALLAVL